MSATIPMIGRTFGRLTVLSAAEPSKTTRRSKPQWACSCLCGASVVVTGEKLRSGQTASCGCLRRDRQKEANTKHGLRQNQEYVMVEQLTKESV